MTYESIQIGDIVSYNHWILKNEDGTPKIEVGIVESVGSYGVTLTTEDGCFRGVSIENLDRLG